MSKQTKKLREQFGLTSDTLSKEELEVLHQKDIFEKNLPKMGRTEGNYAMKDRINSNRIREALRDGVMMIDKECLLSYPLNDHRTGKTLKKNWLEQEELMIAEAQLEAEDIRDSEVYHCAGRDTSNVLRNLEIESVQHLMLLTPEQIKQFRDAEKVFVEKVYSRGDIFG